MKRSSIPLALVASLTLVGTAAAAKAPQLGFTTATTSSANGTVLSPTSVQVVTTATDWIRVFDASWSSTGRQLRTIDFGFEIASIAPAPEAVPDLSVSILTDYDYGNDRSISNDRAFILAADCDGRVGTGNPTCEVRFGNLSAPVIYANWKAFVAAHPRVGAKTQPIVIAQGVEATLVAIDLR